MAADPGVRLPRRTFLRRLALASGAAGCAALSACEPPGAVGPPAGPVAQPPVAEQPVAEQPATARSPDDVTAEAPTVTSPAPTPPSPPTPSPSASKPVAAASPVASPRAVALPAGSPAARQGPGLAEAVSEIVVGALYPLTGPDAPAGTAAVDGLRTVADVANAHTPGLPWPWAAAEGLTGLGGAKVRLVVADHQGSAERGVAEAERLIVNEQVHAIVGCAQNAVTAAVSQACEDAGIPFLAPEAPSSTLHTRGLQWFFRTGPHDDQFTDGMFQFLDAFKRGSAAPIATLGLTYEDTLFGQDSGRGQKELAQQYGYQVVLDLKYRSRSRRLTAEVQRLETADPDVWMPTSYVADAILLIRTSRELDYNPRMVIAQGFGHADPAFLTAVGSEAEGLISRSLLLPDVQAKLPLFATVNRLHRQVAVAAGRRAADLSDTSALAVVGMLTLVDACDRAGSVQPRAIRQALQQTAIPADWLILPWRGVKFEATGQNEQVGVLMTQLRGGRYSTIWPFELATRDVLYPIPPWSQRRPAR